MRCVESIPEGAGALVSMAMSVGLAAPSGAAASEELRSALTSAGPSLVICWLPSPACSSCTHTLPIKGLHDSHMPGHCRHTCLCKQQPPLVWQAGYLSTLRQSFNSPLHTQYPDKVMRMTSARQGFGKALTFAGAASSAEVLEGAKGGAGTRVSLASHSLPQRRVATASLIEATDTPGGMSSCICVAAGLSQLLGLPKSTVCQI